MIGIYFHIPFCISKCRYCTFTSMPSVDYTDSFVNRYIYALAREISTISKLETKPQVVDTVYFGGGTPSLLDPAAISFLLEQLSRYYTIDRHAEITLECNPGTVDLQKLRLLKAAGVNRLSMGAQSFDPEALKYLGRIHSSEQILNSFLAAREVQFDSVSLDFIFGFPNYTEKILSEDLRQILQLSPEHISFYLFTPEYGSPLGEQILNGQLSLPEDEFLSELYMQLSESLAKEYIHYEISNFAKSGFHSRHNMKYWKYEEYRGLGAAACSFRNLFRYENISDPHEYVYSTEHNYLPIASGERISKMRRAGEYVMLALRLKEGLDRRKFKQLFELDFEQLYSDELRSLLNSSLLISEGDFIRIPEERWFLHSEIAEKFIF